MEQGIPNILSLVNEILAFVRESSQGMEIGEVERKLLPMVMAVGKAALQEFVAEKGTGYAGREIIDPRGIDCRMFVTGAVPIGPSSERYPSGEPTIMQTARRESFLWMERLTCLREAIPTWFRSSLPGSRSR